MTLNLRVITHSKTVFAGEIVSATLPAVNGAMGILPRHIPFVTLLDTGVVAAHRPDGTLFECTVSSGSAYLVNDDLTVFADAAETLETIDLDRARAALAAAREWMERHRHDPILYAAGAKFLRRAQNRIAFVEKRKKSAGGT